MGKSGGLAGVLAPLAGFVAVWMISQAAASLGDGLSDIMAERTQFAATSPRVIVRSYYAHRMYAHYTGKIEAEQLSGHIEWLLTDTYAAKDVRLFGLSDYLVRRFRELRLGRMRDTQRIILSRERTMFLASLLSILGSGHCSGICRRNQRRRPGSCVPERAATWTVLRHTVRPTRVSL